MSFDCRLHIAVTPYSTRCVPDGIKAVERFDPTKLGRRPWPRVCQGRGRCPEGGVGGQIVAEQILVIWDGNRLIYPISENPKPLAERPVHYDTEIHYYGAFLAQLDGQVAYEPNPANLEHYIILVESPVAVMHAVRFAPSQTAIIDPFIKHSMPIPLDGQFNFNAWHRSVNVVIQQGADPAGHQRLVVNLCKVNRIEPITLRQVGLPPEEALPAKKVPKLPHLSNSFANDLKQLSDVNAHAFSAYGRLIPDFTMHNEQPTEVPWPGTESVPGDGMAGTLCQEFIVSWKPGGETGQFLELEFEGISGTFAGEKGRPGVEYSPELGSYRANLLMARPDGSFYLQPSDYNDTFALAVALPDSETGEPVDHTLQAFIFRNGQACRLEPGVWHSVPIPIAGSDPVVFTEVVAATNANLVVNVQSETGHPVQFVQSV